MHRFKNVLLFICVFIVVGLVFSFSFFPDTNQAESDLLQAEEELQKFESQPLFVAISAYPFVRDILLQVGHPFVAVQDISAAGEATALFVLDERIDTWAVEAAQNRADVRIFNLRDGAPNSLPTDYYWLAPDKMADVVRYVARSYGDMDPVHAVQYFDNAYAFAYQMTDLHHAYSESLGGASKHTLSLVGSGFVPLLETYDLRKGVVIPFEGVTAAAAAKTIQDVEARLRNRTNEYLLADVTFPASEVDDLRLRDRIILLDPYGHLFSGTTYVDFLEDNMRRLLQL